MKNRSFRHTSIGRYLNELEILDTHEHFPSEIELSELRPTFFSLLKPYICDDLLSSGLTLRQWYTINDDRIDFEVRWRIFAPYLEHICNTTYFLSLKRTLKLRFGIDEVCLSSAKQVNEALRKSCKQGKYQTEFAKMNISSVLNFLPDYKVIADFDSKLFKLVPTVSKLCPACLDDVRAMSDYTGVDIGDIKSLNHALNVLCDLYNDHYIKNIKLGSAYQRKLDFKSMSTAVAEQQLVDIMSGKTRLIQNDKQINPHYVDFEQITALDNYITCEMLKRAKDFRWNVFVHTGAHAWNYNWIERCKAGYLQDIINQFSDVKFILLHCGFPYIDDALLLAKYYPNVYLNLTWTHIIDRYKARELIERIIEMIPQNKVCGFGGDYFCVHNVYGHLDIAKENIASVLNRRIKSKEMSIADAKRLAKQWLYENAKHYFD